MTRSRTSRLAMALLIFLAMGAWTQPAFATRDKGSFSVRSFNLLSQGDLEIEARLARRVLDVRDVDG